MTENEIAKIVVNCCFKIHNTLGAGLFESVYEEVLAYELKKNSLTIERQKVLPVVYDEIEMEVGFRTDIIVANKLIIEIKSVEIVSRVHKKQLLTYLRLSNMKLGLLVNFNETLIKDGISRIVNELTE